MTLPSAAIVVLSGTLPMPADTMPPNTEIFQVIPGVVPPCCLAKEGANTTVVGTWGWNGGAAELTLFPNLVTPNPSPSWGITTTNGAPVLLTRATLFLIRYCTCNRPTTFGIGYIYPESLPPADTPPLDTSVLVAYLQTQGVSFDAC